MDRQLRRYAFWLLMLFALGGVMAPLVHDGFHALSADVHEAHADAVTFAAQHANEAECQLCEVTLLADDLPSPSSGELSYADLTINVTASAVRADAPLSVSRAPPAIL